MANMQGFVGALRDAAISGLWRCAWGALSYGIRQFPAGASDEVITQCMHQGIPVSARQATSSGGIPYIRGFAASPQA